MKLLEFILYMIIMVLIILFSVLNFPYNLIVFIILSFCIGELIEGYYKSKGIK